MAYARIEARVCWARWFSLPDNVTAIRVGSQMKQHQLRRPVEIANAEPNSFIRREIDAYYATNLATRLPTNLSAYCVRYYRRLTFISSASHQSRERCMSFHEKDVFCTVEGLFYKLKFYRTANNTGEDRCVLACVSLYGGSCTWPNCV